MSVPVRTTITFKSSALCAVKIIVIRDTYEGVISFQNYCVYIIIIPPLLCMHSYCFSPWSSETTCEVLLRNVILSFSLLLLLFYPVVGTFLVADLRYELWIPVYCVVITGVGLQMVITDRASGFFLALRFYFLFLISTRCTRSRRSLSTWR